MQQLVEIFIEVLDKKESNYFREFLSEIPATSSWYLISDYCLDDLNKKNDVITFSLLCNYDKYKNIKKLINKLAAKDLKKTKNISEGFLQYLNSPYFYHFSLVIPRQEKLLAKFLNKAPFEKIFEQMYQIYENSKSDNVSINDFCIEAQKRLKIVIREVQRPGFNKKLLREIILTSSFGAAILYLLQKYSFPQKVAWISDRDAIIDKFDGFVFDNMFFLYEIAVGTANFEKVNTEVKFIEPEKEGENYSDELIRIPDYIAGALATIDLDNFENNYDIKDKFKWIFMDVLSGPVNQATLKVECNGKNPLSVYNFKWSSINNST